MQMQVPEKWPTLLDHVGTGLTWQTLSGDSGFWRRVPRICCKYQTANITANWCADDIKSGRF